MMSFEAVEHVYKWVPDRLSIRTTTHDHLVRRNLVSCALEQVVWSTVPCGRLDRIHRSTHNVVKLRNSVLGTGFDHKVHGKAIERGGLHRHQRGVARLIRELHTWPQTPHHLIDQPEASNIGCDFRVVGRDEIEWCADRVRFAGLRVDCS
jgi:hypothetical protein